MEIILFDAGGEVTTDRALARTAEITETDELGRVTRTYGSIGDTAVAGTDRGNSDQLDDDNADFTKGTWDVYVQEDGIYRLAETLQDLGSVMEFDFLNEQGRRELLANMMLLPVWDAMPEGLREEIRSYLEQTRP